MAGKLYVVGTPIGNLSDFSPRAVATLEKVDFIAAEDTRVTVKLLNHFGINKPMLAYYEHNKMERGGDVIARLIGGESCALVSDAGMPAISDPGEDLVRRCYENGIEVESVPGPSALITALAISGMKSGRFCFEGFLSVNKPSRKTHLAEVKKEKRTMIFYEAPHKLSATLKDLAETFGEDRPISLCRELSKLHEQILRTTLGQAKVYYEENAPKGEFVLVVRGAEPSQEVEVTLEDGLAMVERLRSEEGLSARDAVKRTAKELGLSRNELYDLVINS